MKIAVFPNIYNKDVGKLTEQIVAVLFELALKLKLQNVIRILKIFQSRFLPNSRSLSNEMML